MKTTTPENIRYWKSTPVNEPATPSQNVDLDSIVLELPVRKSRKVAK